MFILGVILVLYAFFTYQKGELRVFSKVWSKTSKPSQFYGAVIALFLFGAVSIALDVYRFTQSSGGGGE